jgi:hypothetical protein
MVESFFMVVNLIFERWIKMQRAVLPPAAQNHKL